MSTVTEYTKEDAALIWNNVKRAQRTLGGSLGDLGTLTMVDVAVESEATLEALADLLEKEGHYVLRVPPTTLNNNMVTSQVCSFAANVTFIHRRPATP